MPMLSLWSFALVLEAQTMLAATAYIAGAVRLD